MAVPTQSAEDGVNPYASPSEVEAPMVDLPSGPTNPKPSVPLVFLKWAVVCVISAAPSFVIGYYSVTRETAGGMLLGILTYILLYVAADIGTAKLDFRSEPLIRRTLRIGYGTRIVISVIFPIGYFLDLLCGLPTMMIVGAITEVTSPSRDAAPTPDTFFVSYLATLVQGTVMNLVLFAYMLIVFLIQRAARSIAQHD